MSDRTTVPLTKSSQSDVPGKVTVFFSPEKLITTVTESAGVLRWKAKTRVESEHHTRLYDPV